jgi:putative membrane protein
MRTLNVKTAVGLSSLAIAMFGCGMGGSSTKSGDVAGQGSTQNGTGSGGSTDNGGTAGNSGAAGGTAMGGAAGSPGNADGGTVSTEPAKLTDPQVLQVLQAANQGEVDQAKAALACATNPKVIGFAQKMITDHSAALAHLNALIAKIGAEDSPERESLVDVSKHQIELISSDPQSGACDETYMKIQLEDHSTVKSLIEEVLQPSAEAPEVAAEVSSEKTTVEHHLDEARAIARALGIDLSSNGGSNMCPGGKLTEGQVVKWLMVSNMGEVEDGQMVLKKATIPAARSFAQRMIDDHGAALARVQALATKLGLTPQESQDSREKEISAEIDDAILNALPSPMFDLAYIHIEVLDHYDDLSTIDDDLLPSSCTPELKAEVAAERNVVAMHETLARSAEPVVRAAATP